MTDLIIISRSPEKAYPGYEGHAFYEHFYDGIAQEFDVTVLSSAVDKKEESNGVTYYPWNFGNKLEGTLGLLRAIKDIKPDIIFSEDGSLRTITAFIIGKLFGSSTIMRLAGIPSSRYKIIGSSLLADKKIAISKPVSEHVFGNCKIIYPGSKFPEISQIANNRYEKTRIGYLGRFHYDKGIDRFIDISETLLPSKDKEILVAGYGEYKSQKLAEMSKKYENFTFKGRIPNKESFDYLNSLDYLIVPSRKEGFGRIVVESLYVSTPVIVWNIPVLREIIENENLIVDSKQEACNIIESKKELDLDWFDFDFYDIEREMKQIREFILET